MRKQLMIWTTLILSLLGTSVALAAGYQWKNHDRPFSFLFGNEIDAHQQTRLTQSGDLFGFFYISFTGVITADGYRVATHVDCNAMPCSVGWILNGKARSATLLYHAEPDHPVFLIGRAEIPEPGSYAHFHWLGDHPTPGQSAEGYLLELSAVDKFCFIHHMPENATSDKSCRDNEGIAVNPGTDIATHPNIVTSAPPGCAGGC